jgi:hypothetical protein
MDYTSFLLWIDVAGIGISCVLAVLLAVLWRRMNTAYDIGDVRARNNQCVHDAILRDSTKLWRCLGDLEDNARESTREVG